MIRRSKLQMIVAVMAILCIFVGVLPASSVGSNVMVVSDGYNRDVEVLLTDGAYVRGGTRANEAQCSGTAPSLIIHNTTGTNHRVAFMKFDLTDYMDVLDMAESAKIRLVTGEDVENGPNNRFEIRMLPQSTENWDGKTITYNSAGAAGMLNYANDLCYTSPVGLSMKTALYTGDILPMIQDHLSANPSDNVVTFVIQDISNNGYSLAGRDAPVKDEIPRLIITKQKTELQLAYDALDVGNIVSGQNEIMLPTHGEYGTTITWESSDSSVIDTDGMIYRITAAEGDTNLDPTATLKATIQQGEEKLIKKFLCRVQRNGIIDASEDTYVAPGIYSGDNYSAQEVMIMSPEEGLEAGVGFVAFDLTSSQQNVSDTRHIDLSLSFEESAVGKTIHITPISSDTLAETSLSDLTYDTATELLNYQEVEPMTHKITSTGRCVLDVTDYIKNKQGKTALFKIETPDNRTKVLASETFNNGPVLVTSPIEFTDEYAVDKVLDNISFEWLSTESIDYLTNSLSLPQNSYLGTTITWTSTDEAVIDPVDGTVTRPIDENKQVILTATVTSGDISKSISYNVTVLKAMDDSEAAQVAADALRFDHTILCNDLTLDLSGAFDGTAVSWSCTDNYEVKITGDKLKVTRPADTDLATKLIATVTYGSGVATKEFPVTVLRKSNLDMFNGKQVIASGVNKEYINDDRLDTVWFPDSNEQVICIDMGFMRYVNEIIAIPSINNLVNVKFEISDDLNEWRTMNNSVNLIADKINYVLPEIAAFGRYVRMSFTANGGGIAFLSGYADAISEKSQGLDSISLEQSVTSNFDLPQNVGGQAITWESKNTSVISIIDGYKANVTRQNSDIRVALCAKITADGQTQERIFYIVVNKLEGGGGSSGSGSSGSGSSSGGIQASVISPNFDGQIKIDTPEKLFKDTDSVEWASPYIESLAKHGILNGVGNGLFEPERSIKREELMKLIIEAFNIQYGETAIKFIDADENAWYATYLNIASSTGLVEGFPDGSFGVGMNITRQDAAVMICRAVSLMGIQIGEITSKGTFADELDISDYAYDSVYALKEIGALSGDENNAFSPNDALTRAQAAKVLYMILEYTKII